MNSSHDSDNGSLTEAQPVLTSLWMGAELHVKVSDSSKHLLGDKSCLSPTKMH